VLGLGWGASGSRADVIFTRLAGFHTFRPGGGGLRTLRGSYMVWFDIQSMPFGVPSIFSGTLELIYTLKPMQSHSFLADLSHEYH
jgi:hypothetical protein